MKNYQRKIPKKVLFLQVPNELLLYNLCKRELQIDTSPIPKSCVIIFKVWDMSCTWKLKIKSTVRYFNEGFNVKLLATMQMADIIVTVDGSHNFLLNYARPGS